MTELWTIDELTQLVQRALDVAPYNGQPSARVREVPDTRTIRYYTTLGLLDRPREMRGRTAYYGRRHLLQLVAIKRLQARGTSLGEMQQTLASADDKTLARWAALPRDFWAKAGELLGRETPATSADDVLAGHAAATDQASTPRAARRRFWAERPETATVPDRAAVSSASVLPESRVATVLPLAEGVSLLLEGVRPEQLDPSRWNELQPAIARLVAGLTELGLRSTNHETDESA